LGSTPVLDRPTAGTFYQQHETAYNATAEQEALPDHYPLVTRDGVVPVAALSDRGLYSQNRYRAVAYAVDYTPSEAIAQADYEPAPVRYSSDDEGLSVGDPAPLSRAAAIQPAVATTPANAPQAPLALAQPAAVQSNGTAKTINVEVALAMQ
jgi:hypothetical protein